MRVLITGSEGYLGTVMAEVLGTAGHEVVGLDSGLFVGATLGPEPERPPLIRRDLRDVTKLQAVSTPGSADCNRVPVQRPNDEDTNAHDQPAYGFSLRCRSTS